ncbi:MAG: Ig-like domain-containing protein [Pseudomonadota bacterium]
MKLSAIFPNKSLLLGCLIVLSACDSDRSQPFVPPPEPPVVPTVSFSSNAVKGPLQQSNVVVRDANGSVVAEFTADLATFDTTLPETTTYPATVAASGGIDAITEQNMADVSLTLKSVLLDADQITININPMSTLLVEIAAQLGGVNAENLGSALFFIRDYSFGLPAGFDPVNSQMTPANSPQVLLAYETFFEVVRRIATAENLTPNEVIIAIAADLIDGIMDGVGDGATGLNPAVSAQLVSTGPAVLLEALSGTLVLDKGGAHETTLTVAALNSATETITGTAGTATLAALAPTAQTLSTTSKLLSSSKAATVDAGEIAAVDATIATLSATKPAAVPSEETGQTFRSALDAASTSLGSIATKTQDTDSATAVNASAAQAFAREEGDSIPRPVLDQLTANAGEPVDLDVLANDPEVADGFAGITIFQAPLHGSVVVTNDNTISYRADTTFIGIDSFIYAVFDTDGDQGAASVTITVGARPFAVSDSAATIGTTAVNIPVLENDQRLQDTPITITVSTAPTSGSASVSGTQISYTAQSGFTGTDTLTYQISDASGDVSSAEVTIVVGSSTAPLAAPDQFEVQAGTTSTLDVLANDLQIDDTPLTLTTTQPTNGTVAIVEGIVSYTPSAGFGGLDSFEYTITDASGDTTTATVQLFVDTQPALTNQRLVFNQGESRAINLTENATGIANEPITLLVKTPPANGTFSLDGETLTYRPIAGFTGDDFIEYTLIDVDGDAATAQVELLANITPAATGDSFESPVNTSALFDVLANDASQGNPPFALAVLPGSVGGEFAVDAENNITFTPSLNFAGAASVSYRVTDFDGETAEATVSIYVDDIPAASTDNAETPVLTPVVISVLANDTGLLNTPVAIAVTSAQGGVTSVNADNTVTYAPNTGFAGTDSFQYTITDADGDQATGDVTLFVDDTPVAAADTAELLINTFVAIPVLQNDSGLLNLPVTVTIISPPANGAANVVDNIVTYTPSGGFSGADGFSYRVTDADGDTAEAEVATFVDDLPVAVDDNAETPINTSITINVLANDSGLGNGISSLAVSEASSGTTSVVDNQVSFQPAAGFGGTATFTYTVTDNDGDQATASVTVFVDDTPVAVDDSAETAINTLVTLDVLANDTGLANAPIAVAVTGDPVNGTALVESNQITFTPNSGFAGTASFVYEITDEDGDTATATASIFVDDTPSLVGQDLITPVNTPIVIDIVSGATGLGNTPLAFSITTAPSNGVAVLDGSSLTYTPGTNFAATDTVTFSVTDADGDQSTATASIFMNDTPVATADTGLETPLNTTLAAIPVLANDTGLLNLPLAVALVEGSAVGGTVTVNGDLSVNFEPAPDFASEASFSYLVTDGDGDSSQAAVSLYIDDTPVATADSAETPVATPVAVTVLANDTGLLNTPVVVEVSTGPSNGTVGVANNVLTYTPDAGFSGPDSFIYTVTDSDGDTATATVSTFVDDTPVAVSDSVETPINTAITIDVLANDTGLGNGIASVTATQGTSGSTTISGTSVIYEPATGFGGSDTFSYTVTDTDGDTATSTVSVFVDDTPVAVDDSVETNLNTALQIDVLANDTGLANTPLTVVVDTDVSNGTTSVTDNLVTYTPPTDFGGTVSFTYLLTDADGDTASATVTILVDDKPTLVDQSLVTPVNTPIVVDLLAGAGGLSNTPLAFAVTATTTNGTAILSGSTVNYTPNNNFASTDAFTYTVTDADGDVGTATVSIRMNDTPVANPESGLETLLNTPLTNINVLANDTGLLNLPLAVTIVDGSSVGGTITVNPDLTVNYTPLVDFASAGGFSYRVTDADGEFAEATVALYVDDIPSATDDTAETPVVTAVPITVLANDTGLLNTPVVVTVSTPPTGGAAVVNANVITYTPDPGFANTDTLQYTVTDLDTDAAIASVSIFVDDTPVAVADALTDTPINTTKASIDVLANDSGLGNVPLTVSIDTDFGGTATVNPDNSIDYAPDTDFAGDGSFTYTVTDQDGDVSSATATIFVDDTPVAADDVAGTPLNTPVTIPVTDNDSGLLNGIKRLEFVAAPDGSEGTAVIDGTDIVYTPNTSLVPRSDSFTYRIVDNDDDVSNTATVAVGIGFAAADDTLNVVENISDATRVLGTTVRTIDPLANDALGPDGVLLSIDTTGTSGVVTINGQMIDYTPVAGPAGASDTFKYTISSAALADTKTATVTVNTVSMCTLNNVHCVGVSPAQEFTDPQAAVDASVPGDWVKIKAGNYLHDINDLAIPKTMVDVAVSGTSGNPIRIEAFDGEEVILRGWRQTANGWSDCASIDNTDPNNVVLSADCDADADGRQDAPAVTDELVMRVSGEYIEVRNLKLQDATRFCLEVTGRHNLFENLEISHCYFDNISAGLRTLTGTASHNTFRYIESYRSRHGAGMIMSAPHPNPGVFNFMHDNLVEDSIFYNNGYQPDGQLVPEAAGDPRASNGLGGGNSDGFVVSKVCEDDKDQVSPLELNGVPVDSLCVNNTVSGIIAWNNADDGIDTTWSNSIIQNNISFKNGPQGERGYKILRQTVRDLSYIGNVAMSQVGPAYEIRHTLRGALLHNLAINNDGNRGFGVSLSSNPQLVQSEDFKIYNNVAVFNPVGFDLIIEGKGSLTTLPDLQNNWVEDSGLDVPDRGDPQFADGTLDGDSVNTSFPPGLTIAQKVAFIRDQVRTAFTPLPGSPLIDTGVFIPGVHCATANDDPVTPHDPNDKTCRQWAGAAPDRGAFESGL